MSKSKDKFSRLLKWILISEQHFSRIILNELVSSSVRLKFGTLIEKGLQELSRTGQHCTEVPREDLYDRWRSINTGRGTWARRRVHTPNERRHGCGWRDWQLAVFNAEEFDWQPATIDSRPRVHWGGRARRFGANGTVRYCCFRDREVFFERRLRGGSSSARFSASSRDMYRLARMDA